MSLDPAGSDERDFAQFGSPLLLRLTALLRTARTYDVSNQAFQRQMAECMTLLEQLLEDEDEVALVVVADYFYLNGVRIKASSQNLGAYHSLMSEFERRQVGGLRFLNGVNEAEVERFFQVFLSADDVSLAGRLPELLAEAAFYCLLSLHLFTKHSTMKKVLIGALVFTTSFFSYSQNKMLSMEDAMLRARTTLAPENLPQLQFYMGTNDYVYLKKDVWMRGNSKAGNDTVFLTLDQLNSKLKNCGLDIVKTMPAIRFGNDGWIMNINGN